MVAFSLDSSQAAHSSHVANAFFGNTVPPIIPPGGAQRLQSTKVKKRMLYISMVGKLK